MANVVDYIELAVDDLAESKAFYTKAVGWAFNDYGPDYAGIYRSREPRPGIRWPVAAHAGVTR